MAMTERNENIFNILCQGLNYSKLTILQQAYNQVQNDPVKQSFHVSLSVRDHSVKM